MKLLSDFVLLGILAAAPISSFPIIRREVNDALIPQFGFLSGVNPTGASFLSLNHSQWIDAPLSTQAPVIVMAP
jgi:hypothetical protein